MLIDNLKQIYLKNKDKNPLFVRNLLKESIQLYILDYIFNSKWGKSFVLKGGTCLRFCFDLPRLSEDLDFDIVGLDSFDISGFTLDISDYFVKNLQFSKLGTKIAGNKRTIYLKFPIMKDLGISGEAGESGVVHVRIDFAFTPKTLYKMEVSVKSIQNLSFIIRRYSLEDLFAGKISAITTRETIEGTVKTERFKGRDYYDLVWFLEKGVRPNWLFIEKVTKMDRKEVLDKLNLKIETVSLKFLKEDLTPFFENPSFVGAFVDNFSHLVKRYIKNIQ